MKALRNTPRFDVNQYMQQMFDMFNGPVRKVTMRCENRLAGAMIDRFGTGLPWCATRMATTLMWW